MSNCTELDCGCSTPSVREDACETKHGLASTLPRTTLENAKRARDETSCYPQERDIAETKPKRQRLLHVHFTPVTRVRILREEHGCEGSGPRLLPERVACNSQTDIEVQTNCDDGPALVAQITSELVIGAYRRLKGSEPLTKAFCSWSLYRTLLKRGWENVSSRNELNLLGLIMDRLRVIAGMVQDHGSFGVLPGSFLLSKGFLPILQSVHTCLEECALAIKLQAMRPLCAPALDSACGIGQLPQR
jgi:hypothetical protein